MQIQHGRDPVGRGHLPYPLVLAALWSACLLVIAAGAWLLGQVVGKVTVVVAPLAIAVLLAALLRPLVDLMSRAIPRAVAALLTTIALIVSVSAGLGFVTTQIAGGLPGLRESLAAGTDSVVAWLSDGPLHLTADRIQAVADQARALASSHSNELVSGALTAGHTALDIVAGTLICLIALFFFLYQGEQIWVFFVRWFPSAGRHQVDRALRQGWISLGTYARTQLTVAIINAVGIGIGAAVLGVPFLVPIILLVFLFSFVPILGALLSGLVPTLLALVDKGPWVAVVMLVVVVIVHQVESHVLQPFLMGHAVALHPLAVIVVVTSATYLFGIAGALFAVPLTAMINSVVRDLMTPGARAVDIVRAEGGGGPDPRDGDGGRTPPLT